MPIISIVIVTYNNEDTIQECLVSIATDTSVHAREVIVVDNASTDNTLEVLGRTETGTGIELKLVKNLKNLGFTRAVNQGIAGSKGEYLLILNPDTVIISGFFDTMTGFLDDNPGTGMTAPQHLSPEGAVLGSCREFPNHLSLLFFTAGLSRIFRNSRIFNSWKMGYFDHKEAGEVDQPMGACLMTRRSDFLEAGYLDERFRMFFSDVDLCRRYNMAGKKIYFLPEAKIIHRMGHSIYQRRTRMIFASHRGFIQYFFKYYRGVHWLIPNAMVLLVLTISAFIRILLSFLKRK